MTRKSGQPIVVEAIDGTIHAFPPGTPPTKIERYLWRYENGQDQKSMMVTARRRGRQAADPVALENFENPGAVFKSREEAARDILNKLNPRSRDENREFGWMYFSDPASGRFGYTDPYQIGERGGQGIKLKFHVRGALPQASDGQTLTPGVVFGMGHTHGARTGNNFSRREPWDPSEEEYDVEFMRRANRERKWNFFTLGTPSGNFKMWTPEGGIEDFVAP